MGPFIHIALLCFGCDAEAQNRKVRICVPGVGSGFMHAYLAKERGYFRQEGLDVDILLARGQICTMALISGQMELTTNPNVFDAMVAGKFRGKIVSVLRLEGIIEKITMIIDDTVICDSGKILV